MARNFSAATFFKGPGAGSRSGAGSGEPVEGAVRKRMCPSRVRGVRSVWAYGVVAGHIKDLAHLDCLEDLGNGVDLLGRREVGEVAGMDQEIGPLWQGVDPGHGLLKRGGHGLLVRVFAKPDVAVADLDKGEA